MLGALEQSADWIVSTWPGRVLLLVVLAVAVWWALPADCTWCSNVPCYSSATCGPRECICQKSGLEQFGVCVRHR